MLPPLLEFLLLNDSIEGKMAVHIPFALLEAASDEKIFVVSCESVVF